MDEPRLKSRRTADGIYVWLELPDRDVMLTEKVIKNEKDARAVEEFVDRISYYIFAYYKYKTALNNVLVLCRARGIGGKIEEIIENVLKQFGDKALPGDPNNKEF